MLNSPSEGVASRTRLEKPVKDGKNLTLQLLTIVSLLELALRELWRLLQHNALMALRNLETSYSAIQPFSPFING